MHTGEHVCVGKPIAISSTLCVYVYLHVTCFLAWFMHALENSLCQWLTNNVSTNSTVVWEKFGIKNFLSLVWHDKN